MGIIIIIIALFLVGKRGIYRKWGALISIIVACSGLNLFPTEWLGFKAHDLTLVFALGAWLLTSNEPVKFSFDDSVILKWLKYFVCFLLASAFFSFLYYELTVFDIIQGGRQWFIILLYLFYRKLKYQEIIWLLNALFILSVINGVLYIPQVLFGWHTLPYNYEAFIYGKEQGRYYNIPMFMSILSPMLILCPKYFRINKKWHVPIIGIFIIDMILSTNRTALVALLFSLALCLILRGKLTKITKYVIIGFICILPFESYIENRFMSQDNYGNDTGSDIENVLSGGFMDYKYGNGGTMTFRFAYVYERAEYLLSRPLPEQIFGFGMVSDSNPWVREHYRFSIGNYIMDDSGRNDAMGNADIAYGMMIPNLGFVGTAILLCVYIYMTVSSFRKRKTNTSSLAFFAFCIYLWINSFAGSDIAYMNSLAIYLMMYFILMNKRKVSN